MIHMPFEFNTMLKNFFFSEIIKNFVQNKYYILTSYTLGNTEFYTAINKINLKLKKKI